MWGSSPATSPPTCKGSRAACRAVQSCQRRLQLYSMCERSRGALAALALLLALCGAGERGRPLPASPKVPPSFAQRQPKVTCRPWLWLGPPVPTGCRPPGGPHTRIPLVCAVCLGVDGSSYDFPHGQLLAGCFVGGGFVLPSDVCLRLHRSLLPTTPSRRFPLPLLPPTAAEFFIILCS